MQLSPQGIQHKSAFFTFCNQRSSFVSGYLYVVYIVISHYVLYILFNFSHKKIFWLVILAVLLSLVIFELLWRTNLYNKLLLNPLYILEVGTRITKSLKILEYC